MNRYARFSVEIAALCLQRRGDWGEKSCPGVELPRRVGGRGLVEVIALLVYDFLGKSCLQKGGLWLKRLTLLLVVLICVIGSGCTLPQGRDDAETVLKRYLKFCQEARPMPVSIPMRPYVEFKLGEQQVATGDAIYDSIIFGKETVNRRDFAAWFLVPLVHYDITSVERGSAGRTVIQVSETRYERGEFLRELLGGYYEDYNTALALEERQEEIEKFLADTFMRDFDRNLRNAMNVNTFQEVVTYALINHNGEWKIKWDEISSERNRTLDAELEAQRQEEERHRQEYVDRLQSSLLDLRIARVTVYDDRPRAVVVNAFVKNTGDDLITDTVCVEVELLDENGKAVSLSSGDILKELRPNFTEKAFVLFVDHQAADWAGNYRVRIRIGATSYDVYTEWFNY